MKHIKDIIVTANIFSKSLYSESVLESNFMYVLYVYVIMKISYIINQYSNYIFQLIINNINSLNNIYNINKKIKIFNYAIIKLYVYFHL